MRHIEQEIDSKLIIISVGLILLSTLNGSGLYLYSNVATQTTK